MELDGCNRLQIASKRFKKISDGFGVVSAKPLGGKPKLVFSGYGGGLPSAFVRPELQYLSKIENRQKRRGICRPAY
jgi:hypothetical protein